MPLLVVFGRRYRRRGSLFEPCCLAASVTVVVLPWPIDRRIAADVSRFATRRFAVLRKRLAALVALLALGVAACSNGGGGQFYDPARVNDTRRHVHFELRCMRLPQRALRALRRSVTVAGIRQRDRVGERDTADQHYRFFRRSRAKSESLKTIASNDELTACLHEPARVVGDHDYRSSRRRAP